MDFAIYRHRAAISNRVRDRILLRGGRLRIGVLDDIDCLRFLLGALRSIKAAVKMHTCWICAATSRASSTSRTASCTTCRRSICCCRSRARLLSRLDAHPERLDLLDTSSRETKRACVLVSINSDSHSVHGFADLRFGIGQTRRGWLEAKDILNARPLDELRKLLRATM